MRTQHKRLIVNCLCFIHVVPTCSCHTSFMLFALIFRVDGNRGFFLVFKENMDQWCFWALLNCWGSTAAYGFPDSQLRQFYLLTLCWKRAASEKYFVNYYYFRSAKRSSAHWVNEIPLHGTEISVLGTIGLFKPSCLGLFAKFCAKSVWNF